MCWLRSTFVGFLAHYWFTSAIVGLLARLLFNQPICWLVYTFVGLQARVSHVVLEYATFIVGRSLLCIILQRWRALCVWGG